MMRRSAKVQRSRGVRVQRRVCAAARSGCSALQRRPAHAAGRAHRRRRRVRPPPRLGSAAPRPRRQALRHHHLAQVPHARTHTRTQALTRTHVRRLARTYTHSHVNTHALLATTYARKYTLLLRTPMRAYVCAIRIHMRALSYTHMPGNTRIHTQQRERLMKRLALNVYRIRMRFMLYCQTRYKQVLLG